MKKILVLFVTFILSFSLFGCNKQDNSKKVIENEKRACFDFFWETQVQEEGLAAYGLIPDRYPDNGLASIASVGFGLAAIPIGVDSGYITREEGEERVLKTLENLQTLITINGFYYHFYNYYTAKPSPGSEISVIDTGILICGAMTSAAYFEGEVKEEAQKIYDAVDWNWYINPKTNQFYMGYTVNSDGTGNFSGAWDFYAEQLMLYFLGAGSTTHPIDKIVYDSFIRHTAKIGEYEFIHSWFGSIFTHQFSHAFIDFRNLVDDQGINWYDNSVKATYASQYYAKTLTSTFPSIGELSWGFTACDGPYGYQGLYGSAPSGYDNKSHKVDGTVPPAGAIGSLPFAPDIVIPTMVNYSTMLDGQLIGEYGFIDSYNLEVDSEPWLASDVIGIDKGVSLLMIANYQNEFVWNYFMQNDFMDTAIQRLNFTVKE